MRLLPRPPTDALVAVSQLVRAAAGGEDRAEDALKLLRCLDADAADGEVRALATRLGRRLWALPPGEEATLVRAALAAASLRWPDLSIGVGLDAGLARSLAGVIGVDGAPKIAAARAVRAMGAVALARSMSAAPPDAAVDALLLAGIDAMWHLGGEARLDADPDPEAPAVAPLGDLDASAWRARAVRWGLDPAERVTPPKGWALFAFRATGLAVVHGRLGVRPQRVLFDARDDRVRWDVGDRPVLWIGADAAAGLLDVARVDGRKARVGSRRERRHRQLTLEGSRVSLRDVGREHLRLRLDPDWALREVEGGFEGERDGLRLMIKLDPRWRWSCAPGALRGDGPTGEISCSFELRA